MGYLGLVETKQEMDEKPTRWRLFYHQDDTDGFEFSKDWRGFDPVKKDELITTIHGEDKYAPKDCTILLPHHQDGCYYLVEESK